MDAAEETIGEGLADRSHYIGRIPVRNLWLLMFYASDLFRVRGDASAGIEALPDDLPDLLAEILAHAVEVRRQRRLNLGFRSRHAVLSRVRGRIDLPHTERRRLLDRGRVACRFDDLTIDTPRNRYVRAALEKVSRFVRCRDLAHRCRTLANSLRAMGVSGELPDRRNIGIDQFGRNDQDDRSMVSAARLVFELALPIESAGARSMAVPDREVGWVRGLYERAVGGLYTVVLQPQGWRVRCGGVLTWQIDQRTAGIDRILPGMRTDIVLDHPQGLRRLVIDTKFTAITSNGWHREESLRSAHLYQMYAYLRSQVGRSDPLADRTSGLLLHPCIGMPLDETVVIQGHAIRFATVDLTASASEIRARLLGLAELGWG
jgi:5-methylcytosine-specific restriction enzyme subunit McrC